MIKLGSLFDGIGAFPLVASRYGIMPVWASEIEKFPISVTSKHFPGMKHLGDIREVNGTEIEPVDIITFGSPCQDLSVAGKRAGIQDGERSHLFFEAIRIINEMRIKTNGEYPTFAIWENVPGALSSNGGADFRSVLRAFIEIGAVDIAWRILDAQYFGVPQRRRRIFLVSDFRGGRAGEILFEPESLSGNPAESRKAREEVAGSAGDGTETEGFALIGHGEYALGVGTLRATGGDCAGGSETLIPVQLYDMTHADEVIRPMQPGICSTLNARMGTGGNQVPVCMDIPHAVDCRNLYETPELSGTLQSKQTGGYSLNYQNPVRVGYAVRRLTPAECLRLQGFPDWWLDDIEGNSDTAKYKAIGNSLAVPVVEWIFSRLVRLM